MTHAEATQITAQFVKSLGMHPIQHAIWLRQPIDGVFQIAVATNLPMALPDAYFGIPVVAVEMA